MGSVSRFSSPAFFTHIYRFSSLPLNPKGALVLSLTPCLSIINTLPVPCDVQMLHLWGSPCIERCSKDHLTTMLENGDSQKARFYFPAFRFSEQQNETISTYYLHCITRLCERSTCSTFKVRSRPAHFKQKYHQFHQSDHEPVSVSLSLSGLIHSNATGRGGVRRPRWSRRAP